MVAAPINLAALFLPEFGPQANTEHFFRPWRYTATRREHAPPALGTKCGDFAIL